MKKRLCFYNKNWEQEYKWLASSNDQHEARCLLCRNVSKISYKGIVAVIEHKNSKPHKLAEKSINSSNLVDKFFVKKHAKEKDLVTAIEIAHIYHSSKYHHSYNSLDCSMKLNSELYDDSKIAPKISCKRNKFTAIVCNVLSKEALRIVLDDLKHHDPSLFFCLQIDASNRKNMKMFPLSVQYFNKKYGLRTCLVDFFENANESADGMFEHLKNLMSNLGLAKSI